MKNELSLLIEEYQPSQLEVALHPFVAAYMTRGFRSEERKWRREFGRKIRIKPVESMHFLEFKVFNEQGEELRREAKSTKGE